MKIHLALLLLKLYGLVRGNHGLLKLILLYIRSFIYFLLVKFIVTQSSLKMAITLNRTKNTSHSLLVFNPNSTI